ncbi:serine/threonine protein kinase [Enterococcus haemoperoxidus ATCC BAA-382]|uniref:non-specific serine/threonine protein kinase n=1 Tax=Enterococcus haemoperoxidus ATCC BAA-382 TaxID=1158608 RepID=R2QJG0_9ENTE|nr:Stk1 family PASTA domain-containing Ser/Thr kinase [Enterococcus haemoperoxidus]EOH96742.1 serine/threonine protein kinase [Enterococcus haemoperoxidus ATCC BAA-382]EOT60031.1 serine/threonine protein kinase [Enterococcus haemoperoxidus ATCC BAA-382]
MIEIGRKLNGRYHIIGNIGSGGMANVFLAHDLILDRDVAVKVLRFDFQNDQAAIRRFQREALAATELVHPNIVSVYDVGEEDGLQYLVMEYVKGMDLKRFIQTQYPIPYAKIVDIMEQILSAVSLAHEHRIIHRDLKPQNILMDESGVVKITDFGIAIALTETSITQTNTMLGSVHYLSPEQARGSMATNQSDVYAVGIILYEMLTGNVPFDGESAVTIALKHFQEEMPSVKMFDPNIPQSLENVVLHATAKDPADRYKTAEEMSRDLYTVLAANRLNEPKWQPTGLMGETKILTPITDEMAMPSSFNSMETPPEERNEHEEIEQQEAAVKKKKKPLIIFIVLLVLALIIGGGLYFAGRGSSEVKIPNVEDKTEAEARKILEDAGLKVKDETKEIPNDSIDEGKVVKTDPAIDSTVKKNREVELYISSGNKKIKIDDYAGEDYKDAIEALGKLGFKESQIKITKETDSKVDEDKVISQTPKKGAEVDPKTDEITLVVSDGPDDVYLADYASLGYSYNNAVTELLSYGIKESQITRVDKPSDTVAKDLVIAQNPAAGNPFNPKKGKITLTVSSGPDKTTTTSSESSTVVLGSYAENYTYDNAVNALISLGLKENQISRLDEASDLPKGTVISQDPGAGATFDLKNGKITLKVSTGPSNVSVPNLIGLSSAEAKAQIEGAGLKYVEGSGDASKGKVTSISPSVGDSVAKGTSVTVNFSTTNDPTNDGAN